MATDIIIKFSEDQNENCLGKRADKKVWTDRQTDRWTDRQDDFFRAPRQGAGPLTLSPLAVIFEDH